MASVTAFLKRDWHCFRTDPPGDRFENHTRRVKEGPRVVGIIELGLGVLLLAAGALLLILPGPGIPLVVFGLAMLAGHSRRVAHALDRAELRARRLGASLRRRWQRAGMAPKAAVVTMAVALVLGAAYGAYRMVFA